MFLFCLKFQTNLFFKHENPLDLRQDMLTIQMLKIFDKLLKDEGLDLRFTFYNVLATHYKVGLIEVVPKANTVANIQKEKAFTSATSAFQKGYLRFRLLSIDSSLNYF